MDFLGRGWAFPPVFYKVSDRRSSTVKGTVEMVEGREDINQSLGIILSTSLGERVFRPDFGCNLKDFQFEPMNSGFLGYLKDVVMNALLFHEARILVNDVSINQDNQIEGKLLITVLYTVRSTNALFNFVYDFYVKGEGGVI
jgi:uncharacterized protein